MVYLFKAREERYSRSKTLFARLYVDHATNKSSSSVYCSYLPTAFTNIASISNDKRSCNKDWAVEESILVQLQDSLHQ